MSSTAPTPPEPGNEPGPAFPGFKMGMGAPEHAEPLPAPEDFGAYQGPAPSPQRAVPLAARLAVGAALLVAIAVIAVLLLA